MGDRMMDGMGPMMWGMGLFGLLVLILLALAIAVSAKMRVVETLRQKQ